MSSCYDPLYAVVCTRRDGSRYTRLGLQSGIAFDSDGRPIRDYVIYSDGSAGYVVRLLLFLYKYKVFIHIIVCNVAHRGCSYCLRLDIISTKHAMRFICWFATLVA